jgi:biotin transport system substrate-specific component
MFIKGRGISPSMSLTTAFENYRERNSITLREWREESSVWTMLAASFLFAMLAALAAQLRFFLPFTPVPFTGQVLVVLMAGFVLGRYGMASMGMYLGLGAGLGWFSGMAGASALTGVTAGYLFGFVLAAGFIGLMVERKREWSFLQIVSVMCVGVAIIYALGAAWLAFLLHLDLASALAIGVLPFIAADALKVLLASSAAYILTSGRA